MTPVTAPADSRLFQYSAFLKGEPKALGTVQIMIGSLTFLFGIVLSLLIVTPMVISGITLWGSLVFISSGALSVATAKNHNPCMVNTSLGMNVFSAVVAGVLIILLSVDMLFLSFSIYLCEHDYSSRDYSSRDYSSHHYPSYYSSYRCQRHVQSMYGLYGVLLVFAVLEFIISICTSSFACKATCCSTTTPIYSQQVTTQVIYTQQQQQQQPMNQHLIQTVAFKQVPQQSPVITYNV
ncbi:membrane-spanning 4-domains subfamily A member 4A-like [Tachysurus vachellii]|uniref:membrane-spanning 4-domains subfamily A member 4A-like n=1 Tax=Tachysurus vachellii TaxID=175792 RepID=UPI00296ADB03|nr:membrane-spanning 4-domains subfamily A member 4A-like [Tachysurus vachellii]XP_060724990.1 membrane-spanning 4-domains subfamily A member 4A-like [Tachysurus vachellii]